MKTQIHEYSKNIKPLSWQRTQGVNIIMAKRNHPRKLKAKFEAQEMRLWWNGKDPDNCEVYTNRDAFAFLFMKIAEEHHIPYQLSSTAFFMTMPLKLVPFHLPLRRPSIITPEDRERRREWCRKIGLRNRKLSGI
jgi:hypothetical protein